VLTHWLQHGRAEGRQASLDYDPQFYGNAYPDLIAAFGAGNWAAFSDHYANSGRQEGRLASLCDTPYFRDRDYAANYQDLKNAFGDDQNALCRHFETNGLNEGRVASPFFSVNAYRARYPDLASLSNLQLAYHYAARGRFEGRNAAP